MTVNGLSARQKLGINALLNNPVIAKASKACGIPTRSLTRWLAIPEFQEALEMERQRLNAEAFDNLKFTLSEAVGVLRELLRSESEATRLRAAQAIIDYNVKIAEIDRLEARLVRLEGEEYEE